MSSLKLPKDVEVLRFCQKPRTRYDVKKHLGNHYRTTLDYMGRLEKMGLIFVVKEEEWRPGKKRKWYLITAKGRAILRGHEEAEMR